MRWGSPSPPFWPWPRALRTIFLHKPSDWAEQVTRLLLYWPRMHSVLSLTWFLIGRWLFWVMTLGPSVGYSLFVLFLLLLKVHAVRCEEKEKTCTFSPPGSSNRCQIAFQTPTCALARCLPVGALGTGCSPPWGTSFNMLLASLPFSPLGFWFWPPGQTVGWWILMILWR